MVTLSSSHSHLESSAGEAKLGWRGEARWANQAARERRPHSHSHTPFTPTNYEIIQEHFLTFFSASNRPLACVYISVLSSHSSTPPPCPAPPAPPPKNPPQN